MVSAIMSEQANNVGQGGAVMLCIGSAPTKAKLILPARIVTLSELQRHKRQFIAIHKKAITLGTVEKGAVDWSEGKIVDKFVTYLEENLVGS